MEMTTTTAAAAAAGRPEIAFFDVETTVPTRSSGGYALLEFGAIVVCSSRLVELGSYSTLIRPADLDAISALSVRCNGITKDTVANAPTFRDVADAIYGLLNGRVWAGHNIMRFDCVRIREAFAELGRPAPEPKGVIDTLPLLTQRFGRRAGNMKMASLATYFGLGQQKHRSLDDVRMNLEVVKYCATVLFLEASLPDMSSVVNSEQITTPTRIEGNGNASPDNLQPDITPPNLVSSQKRSHPMDNNPLVEDNHQDISATFESNAYHSTLVTHMEHMKIDTLQRDTTVFACSTFKSAEMLCTTDASCSGTGFLEPDELLPQDITAPVVFSHQYGHKINLLHRDSPLQICSMGMAVRFGVSTKFTDHAGRPKLSIVVDISDNLSKVLDICDQLAQRSSESCGSSSEWRPVIRRNGYSKPSSIRLQIPIVANGDAAIYSTEVYQKDLSGNVLKFGFSKIDIAELDSLFTPGVLVDAYFCLDIYDFQQNAGIRLVAKRLVVHTRQ